MTAGINRTYKHVKLTFPWRCTTVVAGMQPRRRTTPGGLFPTSCGGVLNVDRPATLVRCRMRGGRHCAAVETQCPTPPAILTMHPCAATWLLPVPETFCLHTRPRIHDRWLLGSSWLGADNRPPQRPWHRLMSCMVPPGLLRLDIPFLSPSDRAQTYTVLRLCRRFMRQSTSLYLSHPDSDSVLFCPGLF